MTATIRSHGPWVLIGALGAAALAMVATSGASTSTRCGSWWPRSRYLSPTATTRLFIAEKVMRLDPARPTPAVRHNDGLDYVPTDRYVLFGHHFAAIAGAGPLVGPGARGPDGLPAGHDLDHRRRRPRRRRPGLHGPVLLHAPRRPLPGPDGPRGARAVLGGTALVGTFLIMVIIVAMLALSSSTPWPKAPGASSRCGDHPDRPLHGRLPALHPARRGHGGLAHRLRAADGRHHRRRPWPRARMGCRVFTLTGTICWGLIVYGFIAAILPVWLLLAPRDYLSTFMKIGVIVMLALAIIVVAPGNQRAGLQRVRRPATGRSSPARCSRSCSSPSPAARCPASTR